MEHYFQLRQLELYIFSLKYNILNNLDLTFLKELNIPSTSDIFTLEKYFNEQTEIFKLKIPELCNKKIVYNSDYSGFHLSNYATLLLNQQNHTFKTRDDSILIDIVEKIGDKATDHRIGSKGSIKIVKVPHFLPWFIKEYDGLETVYITLFEKNIEIVSLINKNIEISPTNDEYQEESNKEDDEDEEEEEYNYDNDKEDDNDDDDNNNDNNDEDDENEEKKYKRRSDKYYSVLNILTYFIDFYCANNIMDVNIDILNKINQNNNDNTNYYENYSDPIYHNIANLLLKTEAYIEKIHENKWTLESGREINLFEQIIKEYNLTNYELFKKKT